MKVMGRMKILMRIQIRAVKKKIGKRKCTKTKIAHDINSNNEDSANYNKLNASASSFEPSLHLESYRVFSSQSVQVDGASPPVGISNHPIHNVAPSTAHRGLHVPMPVAMNENFGNPRFPMGNQSAFNVPPPNSTTRNLPITSFYPGMLQLAGMPVPGLIPVRTPAIGPNPGFVQFPGFNMAGMNLPGSIPGVVTFAGHPQAGPRFPSGPPNDYGISKDISQNIAEYEQISHAMAHHANMVNYMAAQQQAMKNQIHHQQMAEAELQMARSKALDQQQAAFNAVNESEINMINNRVLQNPVQNCMDENANNNNKESAPNEEICNYSSNEDELSRQETEYERNASALHQNIDFSEEMRFGDETIKEQMQILEEIKMRRKEELESRKLALQLSNQEEGSGAASDIGTKSLTWSKIADPAYRLKIREKVAAPPEIKTPDEAGDDWQQVQYKKQQHLLSRAQRERIQYEKEELARQAQAEEEAALRTKNNLKLEEEIKEQTRKKLARGKKISLISEEELHQHHDQQGNTAKITIVRRKKL